MTRASFLLCIFWHVVSKTSSRKIVSLGTGGVFSRRDRQHQGIVRLLLKEGADAGEESRWCAEKHDKEGDICAKSLCSDLCHMLYEHGITDEAGNAAQNSFSVRPSLDPRS